MENQYLHLNDLKIRYWRAGEGEDILLVHGIGASIEYFSDVMPILSKHYRVTAVDLPGFGLSSKPQVHFDLQYFANFLNDFCEALQFGKIFLVGHSLGGAICLKYAIDHRDKIKKLFLCNNAGFSRQVTWVFRLLSIPFIFNLLFYKNKAGYRKALEFSFHRKDKLNDKIVDSLYQAVSDPANKKTFSYILAKHAGLGGLKSLALQPLWMHFDKITDLPIFVLWGDHDPLLNVKQVKLAKRWLPHVQVKILKDCGHVPLLEYPEETAKTILQFFAE